MTPYLKEETEANPLVIFDMLLIPVIPSLVYTWMWYIHSHPLPMCRWQCVGRVDPTVGIKHILWNVSSMYTHDWWADILSCGHNKGKGLSHDAMSKVWCQTILQLWWNDIKCTAIIFYCLRFAWWNGYFSNNGFGGCL
jgi:hypothetical protein